MVAGRSQRVGVVRYVLDVVPSQVAQQRPHEHVADRDDAHRRTELVAKAGLLRLQPRGIREVHKHVLAHRITHHNGTLLRGFGLTQHNTTPHDTTTTTMHRQVGGKASRQELAAAAHHHHGVPPSPPYPGAV